MKRGDGSPLSQLEMGGSLGETAVEGRSSGVRNPAPATWTEGERYGSRDRLWSRATSPAGRWLVRRTGTWHGRRCSRWWWWCGHTTSRHGADDARHGRRTQRHDGTRCRRRRIGRCPEHFRWWRNAAVTGPADPARSRAEAAHRRAQPARGAARHDDRWRRNHAFARTWHAADAGDTIDAVRSRHAATASVSSTASWSGCSDRHRCRSGTRSRSAARCASCNRRWWLVERDGCNGDGSICSAAARHVRRNAVTIYTRYENSGPGRVRTTGPHASRGPRDGATLDSAASTIR